MTGGQGRKGKDMEGQGKGKGKGRGKGKGKGRGRGKGKGRTGQGRIGWIPVSNPGGKSSRRLAELALEHRRARLQLNPHVIVIIDGPALTRVTMESLEGSWGSPRTSARSSRAVLQSTISFPVPRQLLIAPELRRVEIELNVLARRQTPCGSESACLPAEARATQDLPWSPPALSAPCTH
eukprot:753523-Hanusia_phi.AAC.1